MPGRWPGMIVYGVALESRPGGTPQTHRFALDEWAAQRR
jgi:hypothetical protein